MHLYGRETVYTRDAKLYIVIYIHIMYIVVHRGYKMFLRITTTTMTTTIIIIIYVYAVYKYR